MNNELIFNKQTGQWEEGSVAAKQEAPRRSWSKTQESADKWDFKFPFEGATIFAKFSSQSKGAEDLQSQLSAEGRELVARANALTDLQRDVTKKTSPEQLARIEEELSAKTRELNKRQRELARPIVSACVVGWENGDVPFSTESVADLPDSICVEWMQTIVSQSRLSQDDANFLGSSSVAS